MPRVFFITGTSTGFGNNLVQEVLDRGDIAIATARKPESLKFKRTNEKVCHLILFLIFNVARTLNESKIPMLIWSCWEIYRIS